jgi:putative ABC transport system permease protein
MDALEHARQVRDSLSDHPRRVAASAMGVFWGTAAIIVLMAFGTGFREFMHGELQRFGRGVVLMYPATTSSGFPGYRRGVPVRIAIRDIARVERELSEQVAALLPHHISRSRLLVEAGGTARRLDLSASDARFGRYRGFDIAHGRFYDAADVKQGRAVAVIGSEAAEDLFGSPESAVGQRLRISGKSFELVGVTEPKGRQYTNTNRPDNRLLIVPHTTAEERLGYDEEAVGSLLLFPRPGVSSEEAVAAVLSVLGPRSGFHPDDSDAFRWFDTTQILGLVDLFYAGFMIFIGVAGTITLLIGGVGIANYHLATISERTTEIAVAKALGARNSTLVAQTVIEALVVAGGAAILGAALGLAACAGLEALAPPGEFPRPIISGRVVLITLGATTAVAVLAATAPALRVRRVEISTALRASI